MPEEHVWGMRHEGEVEVDSCSFEHSDGAKGGKGGEGGFLFSSCDHNDSRAMMHMT